MACLDAPAPSRPLGPAPTCGCFQWRSGSRKMRGLRGPGSPAQGSREGMVGGVGAASAAAGAGRAGGRRRAATARGRRGDASAAVLVHGHACTAGPAPCPVLAFMKRAPRFSSTMPSDAAKNARTWLTKWRSSSFSLSQSLTSLPRSTSSAGGVWGVGNRRGRAGGCVEVAAAGGQGRGTEECSRRRRRPRRSAAPLAPHQSRRRPRPSCTSPRCRGSCARWHMGGRGGVPAARRGHD